MTCISADVVHDLCKPCNKLEVRGCPIIIPVFAALSTSSHPHQRTISLCALPKKNIRTKLGAIIVVVGWQERDIMWHDCPKIPYCISTRSLVRQDGQSRQ